MVNVAKQLIMKHHLTYKDNKSNKFWKIETSGKTFTVIFGKTGTDGRTQSKKFESEKKCIEAADKLIQEKLNKGYVKQKSKENSKVATKRAGYLDDWESIVRSKNLHRALIDHFSYLADSPGFDLVVKAVMEKATNVTYTPEALVVKFTKKHFLLAMPPLDSFSKKYPQSYQNLIRVHSKLGLSDSDNMTWSYLTLGEHGLFHKEDDWFDEVDKSDGILWDFARAKYLLCPIDDGHGNFFIYHPTKKNADGGPVIYYLDHDGGEMIDEDEPQPFNAGSIFLKRITEYLKVKVKIPFAQNKEKRNSAHETWLNNLDNTWKNVVNEYFAENKDEKPSIKKFIKSSYLDLSGSGIKSLEPLRIMTDLDELRISSTGVKDLTPLVGLKNLFELDASYTLITSLEPLIGLKELTLIHCRNTSISFEEILRFRAKRAVDWTNPIYCDYTDTLDTFIHSINKIDFDLAGLENALCEWVIWFITYYELKKGQIKKLIMAYRKHDTKRVSSKNLKKIESFLN